VVLRFGTDGIRGAANVDLTPDLVLAAGRAAARVLAPGPFLVGRDPRRSGPMLEAALAAGLAAEGRDVHLLGVFPTAAVAHLSQLDGVPAAMISASHNPYADNGVKLFQAGGRKLDDDVEEQLEAELDRIVHGGAGSSAAGMGVGTVVRKPWFDLCPRYVNHVVSAMGGGRLDGLRIVVDCANGAASELGPVTLRALGAEVEVLHNQPDGANINEACGSTHPGDLQRAVVELGADAGLAFDGDADRVLAVDERGVLVDGDQVLAIAALDLAERGMLRGDAVVATVMSNLGLRRVLAGAGIAMVETPVGDRHVLEAIERGGFALGGEQSGHVIYADHATTGDGILTGAMLLERLVRADGSLSELAGVMPRFPQVLCNVRGSDRAALDGATPFWDLVADVTAELADAGRVLVRPSGTEPLIRVMVEASTEAAANDAADRLVKGLVASVGGHLT
jgi:phosphoglucosamine mutase